MFRFIVVLLILGCCLTGYRLLGKPWPATESSSFALAQAAVDSTPVGVDNSAVSAATPTVAPFFRAQSISVVTPQAEPPLAVTLRTTQQPATRTIPAAPEQRAVYPELIIYDDQLTAAWTVEHSGKTAITLAETGLQRQVIDPQRGLSSGAASIAVSPQADYGTIFFTVRPESGASYQRQAVVGISLWLNSGNTAIATDDLAIAVVGSNTLPYWTADDQSVFPDKKGTFSETRLYFLKINRTIPPQTWVNLVVWLNDLQYDPVYKYVTGFYLKNDAEFRSTYYLDQVALLLAP